MKKFLLVMLCATLVCTVQSQTTYLWTGSVDNNFNTAANWSSSPGANPRTSPANNDILVFDNVAATVTNIPYQTIGALQIINNAAVTFTSSPGTAGGVGTISRTGTAVTGVSTLFSVLFQPGDFLFTSTNGNMSQVVSIGSSTALTTAESGNISSTSSYSRAATLTVTSLNGLTVSANSTLNLSSTNPLVIMVGTGAKAEVFGTINLTNPAQRFTCLDAEGITFKSGSQISVNGTMSGSAFGSWANASNNKVVFESGSTFNFTAGANPFGASAPASVVLFKEGSTYVHNAGTPSISNRYYANFILNTNLTVSSSMGVMQNFTINPTFTLTNTSDGGRLSLTGNLNVLGTFTTPGPTYPDLLLIGSGALQTVNFGSSVPTFRGLSVGADANVRFDGSCNVTALQTCNFYGNVNLQGNNISAIAAGSMNVRSASTVNTTVSSALSANSVTIVTPNPGGVSNGMLVVSPAFPPNTYIISTSSGTFTTSKYSIAPLSSGSAITFSNGDATIATSNPGGLATAFGGYTTYTMGGNYVFNAATSTPFPVGVSTVSANNLTINDNVVLNRPVGVNGSVTVASGTLTTNDNLIIRSTATSTGRIATGTGTYILGNITQERFIPAKAARKWSFVSSPVSQLLSAGWQQQIHITGANDSTTPCVTHVGLGFDVTALNNPSVFTYNASNTTGSRWVAATNTNATLTIAGTGYRVLVRGPRTGGCALLDGTSLIPSAVTLSSTGAISNADKNLGSFSITYNNNLANNWVLVGNPYPSQISFSALQATNSSKINNTYAIYNPESNSGVYTYWDGSAFTGGAAIPNTTGNVLPSGSAFFVQSIGATNLSLDFTEAHKTASTATIYQRNNSNQKQVRVHYQQADNTQLDEAVVRYAATTNNTDIVSMNSGSNYITALKAGKGMVVQYRDENNLENDEVALNVVSTVNGTYKLNFSQYETLQQATAIYLKDKYTNSLINLNSIGNEGYSFTTDKNNAQTAGADRFSLVFRSINPAVTTISNIKLFPNPASKQVTLQLPNTTANEVYSVRITDISGKVQLQQKLAAGVQQLNINSLAAGNYVVEVMDSKGNRTVEKLVKQ